MRTLVVDWSHPRVEAFTKRVNAILTHPMVDDEFVAIVNGAEVPDGWAEQCAEALDGPVGVVSPLVSERPWWEPISPYAFVARISVLRLVGLDERLMFGWHRVLAQRLDAIGADTVTLSGVSVDPIRTGPVADRQAELYYRQLADEQLVEAACHG